MMCQLLFTVGLLMTCLRWTSAADVPEGTVYVMVEGTTVLHPGSEDTGDIRTVTWKYGADKAAEWSDGGTICYRQYEGRCELNTRTGELTIKHLTLSDSGFYSAEINGYEVNTVQLQVMSPVPKPSVSTWCDDEKTYCLLTCEGTSSFPQSLQYRWKEENDWSNSMKVLKITKENKEPEFSCELKNPVSSSRSDPVQNPFITGNLLWIIAVVLVILLIVIVAVVLYYKLKNISQKEADAEKNEEGTVYEEVDGTAVLHPGSAHTGDIRTVTWKFNGFNIAEWDGMDVLFYRHSHKGRCELNTRTGKLTINHLTLSDSGRYSAEINGYKVNTVQLQVMSKKTAAAEADAEQTPQDGVQRSHRNLWSRVRDLIPRSRTTDPENPADPPVTFRPGEAGDEEEPGETTELLSQSGGVQQESRGAGVQQESRGDGDQQESRGGGVQQESRGDVNDPPDVSSAVASSSGSSADVHHDSAQSPGAAGSSASSPDSGDGTVYEEIDGTAVLHPVSALTGDITSIIWKFSGSTVAELNGGEVFFYEQFKGRCELNTMTGELTINHLTLSDSGSYSVKFNDLLVNTFQLQVMNKSLD